MTHDELVEVARNWLKRSRSGAGSYAINRGACCVVVSEIASGSESPDALGWYGHTTTMIECKASRSDFLTDKKKHGRQFLQQGLGDYRFYLTAEGSGAILSAAELPTGFGWLEVARTSKGKIKVSVRQEAQKQPEKYTGAETGILLSLLRRIGSQAPQGVSIKHYSYETKNRTILETA